MFIDLSFVLFLIIFSIIIFIIFIVSRKKKSRISRIKTYLFVLYIMLIIKITLLPIVMIDTFDDTFTDMLQLIPFTTISESIVMGGTVRQVVGNIILFVPLPFFLKSSPFKIIISGLIMSLSIEVLQLLENICTGCYFRKIDVDDVILNVFGVFIGLVSIKIYKILKEKLKKKEDVSKVF